MELVDEYFQQFGVGEVKELVELLRLCWLELVELGADSEFLQQEVELPIGAHGLNGGAVAGSSAIFAHASIPWLLLGWIVAALVTCFKLTQTV